MAIYLLPPVISDTAIKEVVKKAGLEVQVFSTLRDLIFAEDQGPIVIGVISAPELLVLNRHAATLVKELPTVVMSAPGVVYSGDWVSLASALPAVDWKEIVGKLSKSGHLAVTPEQLEKRGVGGSTYDSTAIRSSLRKSQVERVTPREGDQEKVAFDPSDVETDL